MAREFGQILAMLWVQADAPAEPQRQGHALQHERLHALLHEFARHHTRLLPPVEASVLAYALSALVNFVMQSRFTFRQQALSGSSAVRFVLMHLFCMGVNSGLLWLATGPLGQPAMISQTVIVVFVAGLSYLISRAWVYPPVRA